MKNLVTCFKLIYTFFLVIFYRITPPAVMWAQRSAHLYITFCLEDCKDPIIKIEPESIYFKGVGGTDKKEHEVTINLFKTIDPVKSLKNPKGRLFELVLTKKDEGPYWARLTKENSKFHWLKSDFNKWKDEDDTESEGEDGQSRDLEKV